MDLVCNRSWCESKAPAVWFNKSTREFYCTECARKINQHNPGLCEIRIRDARQKAILDWAVATFGPVAKDKTERLLRFVEEVAELAQALGLPVEKVHGVVDYVYAKPPGDPVKEAGAVGTTFLALCQLNGISAEDTERDEAIRIGKIDPAYFRERHNKKARDGISAGVAKEG